ncbi:thioredoxin family protein [Phanerochaete sordida]|uniref:Thioredoxin n=1 Tax=Phanerochaete sordida TaxID=48140 RepID=A0A9P3LB93_9APHY|nr:thioredoxin family protein [Phanerochaete sordida]
MPVTPISDIAEFHSIIAKDTYTVFDFWAQWCGPCKVISPIFEKLSEQFAAVEFYKIDVDAAEAISQELSIRAMPTFILFKNGQKVKEVVGANPAALQQLLASTQA